MPGVEKRIMLLGRPGAGKTSVALRIVQNTFCIDYAPTVALMYYEHRMSTTRGDVQLLFYDGPWKDMRISALDGFMVIFDLASLESVEEADNFVQGLPDTKPVALIGNKADLLPRQPSAITEAINGINHPILYYAEISAKLGYNILEPLLWITRQVFADPGLTILQDVPPIRIS